jgi:hypothetical protein
MPWTAAGASHRYTDSGRLLPHRSVCALPRSLVPRVPAERQQQERLAARAREQLDEATWTNAWEEGRATSLEQAIAYALEESE